MEFNIGARVKIKDNYYYKMFRGYTGKVVANRAFDKVIQLDEPNKGQDIDGYKNCIYAFNYELEEIKKPRIKHITLEQISKEADKENKDLFLRDELFNSVWTTMDMLMNPKPDKKTKKLIEDVIQFAINHEV